MSATNQKFAHVPCMPSEVVALLSGLHLSEPDINPLEQLSKEQWTDLIAFCDIAHLTLPLAQLATNDFPEWVRKRLSTNLTDNAQRFERLRATYCEIDETLRLAGVEHIVIKGFTQAPDYVASPRLRGQSDFDIVCLPEQIEIAQAALERVGYQPYQLKKDSRADHVPTLVRHRGAKWKGNPFDPDIPLGVDLHFCLWNEPAMRFSIEVDDFWKRRTTRTVEGLTFPTFHPVDQLGYLTLHILRNILRSEWIIHLVRELAGFLHSHANDNSFWTEWTELHDSQLRSYEAIAFYYAREWFGCSLHPLVEETIASLRPIQLHLLSRTARTGLEHMFRQNKDSIWLHMTLLSSLQTKGATLVRTFIPSSVSSVSSPAVLTRNKRHIQPKSNSRWIQYVSYLVSRSSSHLQADLTALARGTLLVVFTKPAVFPILDFSCGLVLLRSRAVNLLLSVQSVSARPRIYGKKYWRLYERHSNWQPGGSFARRNVGTPRRSSTSCTRLFCACNYSFLPAGGSALFSCATAAGISGRRNAVSLGGMPAIVCRSGHNRKTAPSCLQSFVLSRYRPGCRRRACRQQTSWSHRRPPSTSSRA